MLLFSLTMSLSPGPVNLLILSAGQRHGVVRTLPFVSGATLGFTALLALVGHALADLMNGHAMLKTALNGLGTAFVVYIGWRIATAPVDDRVQAGPVPTFLQGWLLQWLNPKAWVACAAGAALFARPDTPARLQVFIAVYFGVCYLSLVAWAVFGRQMARWLTTPARGRAFNVTMGASLVLSALLPCTSVIAS